MELAALVIVFGGLAIGALYFRHEPVCHSRKITALAWAFLTLGEEERERLRVTYAAEGGKHVDELTALRMAGEMRAKLSGPGIPSSGS